MLAVLFLQTHRVDCIRIHNVDVALMLTFLVNDEDALKCTNARCSNGTCVLVDRLIKELGRSKRVGLDDGSKLLGGLSRCQGGQSNKKSTRQDKECTSLV